MALIFVLGGVLRGAGDTAPSMFLTFISLWLVRIPLATYLSSGAGLGVAGIWMAIAVSSYIGVLLHYTYYRTGRWKARVVARRREPAAQVAEAALRQAP